MRLGRNMGCGLSRFGLARKRTHPTTEGSGTSLKRTSSERLESGRGDRTRSSKSRRGSRKSSSKSENTKIQKPWRNSIEPSVGFEVGDAGDADGRSSLWRVARTPFMENSYGQDGNNQPTDQELFIHKLKLIQAQKAKGGTEGAECFMEMDESSAPTQSQIEFFRTLDEKIAKGHDHSCYSPSLCS